MNRYLFLFGSSVGKKVLMAITGLGLLLFLAGHLLGNLMIFAGADAFNDYAAKLHSMEPFLSVFNVGLATIGILHIGIGLLLFLENRQTRPQKYAVYNNPGGRTLGSDTMPYTGLIILVFVILHLLKFTFVDKSSTSIYQLMAATFANHLWVIGYVVAMAVVAIHISHGFWSMFQTFGLNNPDHMPLVMKLGWTVTLVFGFGFGFLPVYLLIIV